MTPARLLSCALLTLALLWEVRRAAAQTVPPAPADIGTLCSPGAIGVPPTPVRKTFACGVRQRDVAAVSCDLTSSARLLFSFLYRQPGWTPAGPPGGAPRTRASARPTRTARTSRPTRGPASTPATRRTGSSPASSRASARARPPCCASGSACGRASSGRRCCSTATGTRRARTCSGGRGTGGAGSSSEQFRN